MKQGQTQTICSYNPFIVNHKHSTPPESIPRKSERRDNAVKGATAYYLDHPRSIFDDSDFDDCGFEAMAQHSQTKGRNLDKDCMTQLERIISEDCYFNGYKVSRPNPGTEPAPSWFNSPLSISRILKTDLQTARHLIDNWEIIGLTPKTANAFIKEAKADLHTHFLKMSDLATELRKIETPASYPEDAETPLDEVSELSDSMTQEEMENELVSPESEALERAARATAFSWYPIGFNEPMEIVEEGEGKTKTKTLTLRPVDYFRNHPIIHNSVKAIMDIPVTAQDEQYKNLKTLKSLGSQAFKVQKSFLQSGKVNQKDMEVFWTYYKNRKARLTPDLTPRASQVIERLKTAKKITGKVGVWLHKEQTKNMTYRPTDWDAIWKVYKERKPAKKATTPPPMPDFPAPPIEIYEDME